MSWRAGMSEPHKMPAVPVPPHARACAVETPVGLLTVMSNGRALIRIAWGRPARAGCDDPLLQAARAELAAYFAHRLRRFTLPLAPHGSAFARRVWEALCRIPYGRTVSYGALAADLGSAPRAIGRAVGANPIPIIIPCHRVVGAGGELVGYSGAGGIATKRALLLHEGALLC